VSDAAERIGKETAKTCLDIVRMQARLHGSALPSEFGLRGRLPERSELDVNARHLPPGVRVVQGPGEFRVQRGG